MNLALQRTTLPSLWQIAVAEVVGFHALYDSPGLRLPHFSQGCPLRRQSVRDRLDILCNPLHNSVKWLIHLSAGSLKEGSV